MSKTFYTTQRSQPWLQYATKWQVLTLPLTIRIHLGGVCFSQISWNKKSLLGCRETKSLNVTLQVCHIFNIVPNQCTKCTTFLSKHHHRSQQDPTSTNCAYGLATSTLLHGWHRYGTAVPVGWDLYRNSTQELHRYVVKLLLRGSRPSRAAGRSCGWGSSSLESSVGQPGTWSEVTNFPNYQDVRRHTKPNPLYCTPANQELVYPTSCYVRHLWGWHSVYLQGIFDAILSDIHLCLQSSYAHSHGWRHLVDHELFLQPSWNSTISWYVGSPAHLRSVPWWGSSAECMAKALAVSTSTPSGCWKASVYYGGVVSESPDVNQLGLS